MTKESVDWRTIEISGYTYYSSKGYRILVSLANNTVYNFAIEKDGEFSRVHVTQAFLKDRNKPNSWAASRTATTLSKSDYDDNVEQLIDIYLVWLPHQARFIELEADFFSSVNSKNRLIPKYLL